LIEFLQESSAVAMVDALYSLYTASFCYSNDLH